MDRRIEDLVHSKLGGSSVGKSDVYPSDWKLVFPVETPTICEAFENLVLKQISYGDGFDSKAEELCEAAYQILNCLNDWVLDFPARFKADFPRMDSKTYERNYNVSVLD